MIRLFAGYDEREAVGFHCFVSSVIRRATKPVCIHPLAANGLPVGSNAFTYSRFLVPFLMGFKGHAIFADASDMIMLGDVAELDGLYDDRFAVQVVKHQEYKTKHPIKYRGTDMQCPNLSYARKNWTSLMILNCEHSYWRCLDIRTLSSVAGLSLLQLGGLKLKDGESEVGGLPPEWNVLVDEGQESEGAKLLHWTAGIPGFEMYKDAPRAIDWHAEHDFMRQAHV